MTSGVVVQVNISAGGVPKLPIDMGRVDGLGIAGDKHLYRLHGGRRKALLLMAAEVIDVLAREGFAVYYGAMGENVTTRGLDHLAWRAGQRYRVGGTLIELTEARTPCRKLDPFGKGIQKRIRVQSGVSGYYAAVLETGTVCAGDSIHLARTCIANALTG